MTIPKRIISKNQLHLFNGDDEDRIFVAYQGIVHDVTNCPKWRNGLHEGQHFPGQDLTAELENDAPHTKEVFKHPYGKVIGRLRF
jgi:predicted heme/steroid binding protein